MVDNYILMFSLPNKEKQERILNQATTALKQRIQEIKNQTEAYHVSLIDQLLGRMMHPSYDKGRKTKDFNVNTKCISCKMCADLCPSLAIELKDGKPVWVKDKCNHCLACLHHCPTQAINYGTKTIHRGRYVCDAKVE